MEQKRERTYAAWAEGFTIFAKYSDEAWAHVAAEHDIIYAGPNPEEVLPEDTARLEVLGWYPDEDVECFIHYT